MVYLNPNQPNGLINNPVEPKKADSDSDSVNDSDSDSDSDNVSVSGTDNGNGTYRERAKNLWLLRRLPLKNLKIKYWRFKNQDIRCKKMQKREKFPAGGDARLESPHPLYLSDISLLRRRGEKVRGGFSGLFCRLIRFETLREQKLFFSSFVLRPSPSSLEFLTTNNRQLTTNSWN